MKQSRSETWIQTHQKNQIPAPQTPNTPSSPLHRFAHGLQNMFSTNTNRPSAGSLADRWPLSSADRSQLKAEHIKHRLLSARLNLQPRREELRLIESCPPSLLLWPDEATSSFSPGTQRVNGCWDYATTCQTPFSSHSLPPPPPPPLNGPEPNEAFLHVSIRCIWMQRCSRSGTDVGTKQGFSFREEESSPQQGLTPACRGESYRKVLQQTARPQIGPESNP